MFWGCIFQNNANYVFTPRFGCIQKNMLMWVIYVATPELGVHSKSYANYLATPGFGVLSKRNMLMWAIHVATPEFGVQSFKFLLF